MRFSDSFAANLSKYHQIVTMNDLRPTRFARLHFGRAERADFPRELRALQVANPQHVPRGEFASQSRPAACRLDMASKNQYPIQAAKVASLESSPDFF